MLEKMFKALLSTEPWLRDPDVLPIPYRPGILASDSKLALGIFAWDGVVTPHPPVQRAILYVKEALAAEGHEVRKFARLFCVQVLMWW